MAITCFFFISIVLQLGCQVLADAIVDPARDPCKDSGDDPPTAGDIGYAAFFANGPDDLAGCRCGRGHPKGDGSLCHFRIYKAGPDIGDVEWNLHFAGFDTEAFKVNALEGFGRAVGGGVAVAAKTGNGRNGDQVAMRLADKITPAEMDGGEKSVYIDIDGRLVDVPIEH